MSRGSLPHTPFRLPLLKGKIHWKNTLEQLKLVGPKSLGVALLTAGFVGMVSCHSPQGGLPP